MLLREVASEEPPGAVPFAGPRPETDPVCDRNIANVAWGNMVLLGAAIRALPEPFEEFG